MSSNKVGKADKEKELEQEKIILQRINDKLSEKNEELNLAVKELQVSIKKREDREKEVLLEIQSKLAERDQQEKEKEQERKILERINNIQSSMADTIQSEKEVLTQKVESSKQQIEDVKQEKSELKEEVKIATAATHKMTKKYYYAIVMAAISIALITTGYMMFVVDVVLGIEHKLEMQISAPTSHTIQNLAGDEIETWLAWRIPEGESINVKIIEEIFSPEQEEIIEGVFMSDEVIEIDDSLLHKGPKGQISAYYLGWYGALKAAASQGETFYTIPTKFTLIQEKSAIADITIRGVPVKNADGYLGYTNTIADEANNQVLKADITIYEINDISNEHLETLLRHEVGHAMGLSHSTDPDDLMAPIITTYYPYMSPCDVQALHGLYNNNQNSRVICDK